MGSASGWPGRAWTPLRVIHSGRWRCMGAPPLGPGCILAFHPPVAPCCCAGSSSAGAPPALSGQPSCLGGARRRRLRGRGLGRRLFAGFLARLVHLDGGRQHPTASPHDRIRVAIALQRPACMAPVSTMLWEGGRLLPPCELWGSLLAPAAHAGQSGCSRFASTRSRPRAGWIRWDCAGPPRGGQARTLGEGCSCTSSPLASVVLSPLVCLPVCMQPPLHCSFSVASCARRLLPLFLDSAYGSATACIRDRDPLYGRPACASPVLAPSSPAFPLQFLCLPFCPLP